MSSSGTIDTDVLIVGGGIAGPALATALAHTDLNVVLLERSADPLDTARGDHLQPRSVSILESWGALSAIRDQGAEQRAGTRWYAGQGEPLLSALVDDLDIPHPYFLYLNHEKISQALLATAQTSGRFKMVRPIRGWQLTERREASIQVEVTGRDGEKTSITSRILVGADGHNSQVRRVAGIEVEQQRYQRPINVLFAARTQPPTGNCLEVFLGAQGILAVIPRAGGHSKIGYACSADQVKHWRQASAEQLTARLCELAPALPLKGLHYGGVYPPTRVTAKHWVASNIVLIGDACHAMHPAQSQGMNVTIRCVDALAKALTPAQSKTNGDLNRALAVWQTSTKPRIDAVLEGNHQAGLLFDSTDSEQLDQFAQTLRQINASPEARRNYALRSAGY